MELLDRYEGRSVAEEYLQLSMKSTTVELNTRIFSGNRVDIRAESRSTDRVAPILVQQSCSEVVSTPGVESFKNGAVVI